MNSPLTPSPTPWHFTARQLLSRQHPICRPMHYSTLQKGKARWEANGRYIVRAVNCHEELLGVVKGYREDRLCELIESASASTAFNGDAEEAAKQHPEIKELDALIARAEGKAPEVAP